MGSQGGTPELKDLKDCGQFVVEKCEAYFRDRFAVLRYARALDLRSAHIPRTQ